MKKIMFALILFVAIAAFALYAGSNIVLATVLEQVIGAPVKVGSVSLSPSQIGIYGLEVKNPDGFSEESLASIPEIYVSFELKQLLSGTAHIRQVRLNLDEITVERGTENQVNLMELGAVKQMLEKKETAKKVEKPKADGEPAKAGKPMHVQIDLVTVSLGRARYVDNSKGKATVREFALDVKSKEFHDITEPEQIVTQIAMMVLQKVGLNALVPDFDQFMAGFQGQAQAKMEEMKSAIGGLTEKMKLPFGQQQTAAN